MSIQLPRIQLKRNIKIFNLPIAKSRAMPKKMKAPRKDMMSCGIYAGIKWGFVKAIGSLVLCLGLE